LTRMTAIGIDIGATKILTCLVDADGAILREVVSPTPPASASAVEDAVAAATSEVLEDIGGDVTPIGVSVAGWVSRDRKSVLFSPHLAWRHEPLADRLSARLGQPVFVENDANAAAWGEFVFGAGRGFSDVAVVTVGSGIGAGIISDGRLLRGGNGLAGEFGHTVVDPRGPDCACGRRGCVDSLSSGRALERHYNAIEGSPEHGTTSGVEILELARAGKPSAVAAFHELGRWLGTSLGDLVMYFDPQIVLLGGGVSGAGELLTIPTERALAETIVAHEEVAPTMVRVATLGHTAGAIGAANLALKAERQEVQEVQAQLNA
jgi:glucokinase